MYDLDFDKLMHGYSLIDNMPLPFELSGLGWKDDEGGGKG